MLVAWNILFSLSWAQPTLASEPSIERLMLLHELKQAQPQHDENTNTVARSESAAKPLRVLIDVRSNHSDGAHDFSTLIQWAKQRHIDALTFTEHDRFTIRLGLEPMPSWIGYSQEHPSLYLSGVDAFFQDIHRAQEEANITIMAGTESTPGYYWQGIPFKNLSLHDAEKHFITLGAQKPEHIQGLTSYALTHAYGNKGLSLIFWFVLIFILLRMLTRQRKRSLALLLLISVVSFVSTWFIKPGIHSDQDFMQSAAEQGLFTIWTHPGTLSGVREGPMGVQLTTPPYNKHIFDVPADAFAAVYGDTDANTAPFGLWDKHLMDYMKGYIAKPMWGVAAGDYHEEGQANEYLGNFPMDVWAESNSESDILAALRQGRMTAWHMNKQQNLSVHTLSLTSFDPVSNQPVQLFTGDKAATVADIQLSIGIEERGKNSSLTSLSGQWIINGQVHKKVTVPVSSSQMVVSNLHLSQGQYVIRFQIPAQQGIRLESNPFFVQVR